ncbi:MAG: hypothetical protein ABIZ81_05665 [Opitutaceae bacterium]
MTNALKVFLACLVLLQGGRLAAKEESFPLYEDHRVTIDVPEGYSYERTFSEEGVITVRIADPKREMALDISFLPDPEERFATPRARREFMVGNFHTYVAGSVEKEMRFEELKPRLGNATICVFTDVNLVGKTELPRGEYLNATTGMKRWTGCAAFFTLLSNGIRSPAYEAALKIITESVHEKKPQASF